MLHPFAMSECRVRMQEVAQADVLHPPLLQPIFSFWSPIPTRTRTITAQLQGNQILPFPAYQEQATLGAIKSTLSNVAIFVSLSAAIPSTAGDPAFSLQYLPIYSPRQWAFSSKALHLCLENLRVIRAWVGYEF